MPVRFSLSGIMGMRWEDCQSVATSLDELGFYGFYASDHLWLPGWDPSEETHEAFTLLAGLAAHTRRIRLGPLVAGNLFRYPALVAKMVTTIDHISGGRAELGIGANWAQEECDAYGIPFPPLEERIARLHDSVRAITSLWTNERTTQASAYYPLANAPLLPKPIHRPRLIVGGSSSGLLEVAARFADEWNSLGPRAAVERRLQRFNRICEGVGRDPTEVTKSVQMRLYLVRTGDVNHNLLSQIATRIRGLQRLPPDVAALSDDELASQSALVGGPAQVADAIAAWQAAGVQHLIMPTPRPFDRRILEEFAAKVMPQFQR